MSRSGIELEITPNVADAVAPLGGVESAMDRLARAAGVTRPPGPPSTRLKRPNSRKQRRLTVRASRRANRA